MTNTVPPTVTQDVSSRRYLGILLGAILTMALGLGGFGLWMGPPSGDLVRIGGWSERNFGWQGPKRGFGKDYYHEITLTELLESVPTDDIVVFGDSFSIVQRGGISWINTLHEQTGRTLLFVRHNGFGDVVRYLDSPAFETSPPAAVIVQSVERETVQRAIGIYDATLPCEAGPMPLPLAPTSATATTLHREVFYRRTRFDHFDEVFSWGALVLRKRLEGTSKSILVQLDRDDLFSNRAAKKGLIYIDDIRLHTADAFPQNNPEAAADRAMCSLRQLAVRAGAVPMRFMVAPDKRTIYQGWITTRLAQKDIDVFALAHEALGAGFIDLLTPLTEAADVNQDVYFPNDTHWGPIGHTIAGTSAAESLR